MNSIIIVTGDIEDIVLITDLINRKHNITLLSFKYNYMLFNKHSMIIEEISKIYNLESIQIDVSNVDFLFNDRLSSQFIQMSYAVALCNQRNANMYISDHKLDYKTNNTFITMLSKCISVGSNNKLELITPYLNMELPEIVRIGIPINANFNLSWSCSESDNKACGTCDGCKGRYAAFAGNHFPDPLIPIKSHPISYTISVDKKELIEIKPKVTDIIKSVKSEKQGIINVKEAFKKVKPYVSDIKSDETDETLIETV